MASNNDEDGIVYDIDNEQVTEFCEDAINQIRGDDYGLKLRFYHGWTYQPDSQLEPVLFLGRKRVLKQPQVVHEGATAWKLGALDDLSSEDERTFVKSARYLEWKHAIPLVKLSQPTMNTSRTR